MKGSQNQFMFLHEQHSDFPFPVFAEEWGFVGSLALVVLYAFLVLWSLRVAAGAKDRFGAVLAVGVGSYHASGTRSSTSAWPPGFYRSSASRSRSSRTAARA
jgi:cell division protein FtsW (lipid II flippase)